MYELNRARLVGIGPRGARYTDVTLDLSNVGVPLPRQSLFDAAARRPSPYTLLMLENGGGKSVLLSLLFSVVLPGRKKTVGGAAMENYVLSTDTGHVVLEWMHQQTGQRFITGKVYQRRAATPGNSNPLTEAWYSFRPTDTLHIGSLPFADDGRRRRLDGYREALDAANKAHPATDLVWLGDDQSRWKGHLREQGIEPDLFDIQRSMNADEGDAADAFKFSSSKAFVDWLLRTVTDPADAASVAETFEQWAITLADRTKMLLEKDFLEGAIAGLEPLADAWQRHLGAERHRAQAETRGAALLAEITARQAVETTRAATLDAEAEVARTRVADAERVTREARDTRNEIQLVTSRLEREVVQAEQEQIADQLSTVEVELSGWDAVSVIQAADEATATARALADQVDAKDKGAAGDLRRRDEAAGRLLAKLDAEIAVCHEEESSLAEAEQAARASAESASQERSRAQTDAGTSAARIETATALIEAAAADLETAASRGLVTDDTTIKDVPGLAETAGAEHAVTQRALEDAKAATDRVRARLRDDDEALTKASARLVALVHTAEEAGRAAEEPEIAAVRVATHPAIAARIGADDRRASGAGAGAPSDSGVDDSGSDDESSSLDGPALNADGLDTAAGVLLDILAEDIAAHTEQIDELRQQQREDARVLDALGEGGLLPARQDVDRAVKLLVSNGVAAHSGWRYLRDTASVTVRENLIIAHPALADGVVLVDPGQLEQARQLLTEARLLPAGAVAVGAGAQLLSTPSSHDAADKSYLVTREPTWFVVPPSPSMYDEDAAEVTRGEILKQMEARTLRMSDLGTQLAAASEGRALLSAWRQNYPPGRLEQLRSAAHAAAEASERQRAETDELHARREEAASAVESAVDHHQFCVDAERAASERAVRLQHLAERVADAERANRDLPALRQALRDAGRRAEEADASSRASLRQIEEIIRRTADVRATAARLRNECDEVPSTDSSRSATVPAESLSELRAAVKATHDAYLAAAPDDKLKEQAAKAEELARQRRKDVSSKDPVAVAEGRRLLATPAGADRTGWVAARDAAVRTRQHLAARSRMLTETIGQLTQRISQQQPESGGRWIALASEQTPTSVEHGRTLERAASAHLAAAQAAFETERSEIERIRTRRADADQAVAGFTTAGVPLRTLLRAATTSDSPSAIPYAGSVNDALASSDAAARDIYESRESTSRTKAALDDATDELVQFTHQARYDDMPNKVRLSILGAERAQLGARSREWADALAARHVSLLTDLDGATRHRSSIVSRLSALVSQALGTLHLASRLSRLPEDLGDWGRRPFLRIGFSEPDAAAISVRVASVVDDLASSYSERAPGGRGTRTRRDGMTLLLEAVHAAVPKGFHVDILKPDSVLRDERVAVEQMKEVFSGGQELTAAIVLYCTLAALKANQRGQMRSPHSGVLFLDNPIGKASATYLLDVQQAVARSLGVQLIYTTGLFDDRVLASFPLWIRLRNDADLRAGLKHLRVAEVVARQLPDPYDDGELHTSGGTTAAPATVTAARVHRRRPATQATRVNGSEGVPA